MKHDAARFSTSLKFPHSGRQHLFSLLVRGESEIAGMYSLAAPVFLPLLRLPRMLS
jgi:hypothetical protein